MRMLLLALMALAFTVAPVLAGFTVYQGSPNSGHVLGTFDTLREARTFARQHHGIGESIVNDRNGNVAKSPGRVVHGNGSIKHSN